MTPSGKAAKRGLIPLRPERDWVQYLSDLSLGLQNLTQHKLRSLLTMLGMIFGVAAVVSMLSIGAGAQQQVMAFIEQLGLRNVVVEAKEAVNYQEMQKTRKTSPGLSFQDYRVIRANVAGLTGSTPRKRFTPTKLLPKPSREMPVLYGVEPSYEYIANLRVVAGRFFSEDENMRGAPVACSRTGSCLQFIWSAGSRRAIRESEHAVVPRNRCGRAPTDCASSRRRTPAARPQQFDLCSPAGRRLPDGRRKHRIQG